MKKSWFICPEDSVGANYLLGMIFAVCGLLYADMTIFVLPGIYFLVRAIWSDLWHTREREQLEEMLALEMENR